MAAQLRPPRVAAQCRPADARESSGEPGGRRPWDNDRQPKRAAVSCSRLLGGRLVRLTELVDLKGKAAAVSDFKAPVDNAVLK